MSKSQAQLRLDAEARERARVDRMMHVEQARFMALVERWHQLQRARSNAGKAYGARRFTPLDTSLTKSPPTTLAELHARCTALSSFLTDAEERFSAERAAARRPAVRDAVAAQETERSPTGGVGRPAASASDPGLDDGSEELARILEAAERNAVDVELETAVRRSVHAVEHATNRTAQRAALDQLRVVVDGAAGAARRREEDERRAEQVAANSRHAAALQMQLAAFAHDDRVARLLSELGRWAGAARPLPPEIDDQCAELIATLTDESLRREEWATVAAALEAALRAEGLVIGPDFTAELQSEAGAIVGLPTAHGMGARFSLEPDGLLVSDPLVEDGVPEVNGAEQRFCDTMESLDRTLAVRHIMVSTIKRFPGGYLPLDRVARGSIPRSKPVPTIDEDVRYPKAKQQGGQR